MFLWAICLVLVMGGAAPSMQPPILGPDDGIGFDYYDADLVTYQVLAFNAQWDGGAWVSIGTASPRKLADTLAGASTYLVIPPFTSGQHSVSFQACNAVGCGGGSSPFRVRVRKR